MSEFANASMLAKRGSGGALGSGSGASAGRSGGVSVPAGSFGSKKPAGRKSDATRSTPRAASPASRKPGLSPTRGSGLRSCARPIASADTSAADTHHTRTRDLMSSSLQMTVHHQGTKTHEAHYPQFRRALFHRARERA